MEFLFGNLYLRRYETLYSAIAILAIALQKLAKKLIKIAQNCVVFCTFSVSILFKIFAVGGWGGGHGPQKPPPLPTPLLRSIAVAS